MRVRSGPPVVVKRAPLEERPAPGARAPATSTMPALERRGDVVDAMLLEAAALAKSDELPGSEKLLSAREARRASEALTACSTAHRARLVGELKALSPVGRALLLRALAARREALASDARAAGAVALITRFAARMASLDDGELRRRATSLDLDPTASTSAFAPQALWQKRGVTSERGHGDVDTENDGLFQRFTGACGPATLQMMLAEADPVFAFALHDEGLTSSSVDDAVARFQRALLDVYGGGKALGRVEAHLRARLNNALGRLDDVDEADKRALRRHLLEQLPLDGGGARALAALRARFHGFPNDEAVTRLRAEPWPKEDEGILPDALQALLDEHVTPLTGARYLQLGPPYGFQRGQAYRYLDDVVRALRRGHDVPFGICEPGHWMLLSAVKGRKPRRELLVSDPDSGKSAWVSERSFLKGSFADEVFHLPQEHERPYVDCFFVPEGA